MYPNPKHGVSNTRKSTSKSIGKASVPTIGAGQFKAVCLDLMDKVKERHAEYIVTKRGQPYARLVPFDSVAPSPFGFMQGTVLDAGDVIEPDAEAWADAETDPLLGG